MAVAGFLTSRFGHGRLNSAATQTGLRYYGAVGAIQRMIVLMAAAAIFFALVFPLAPTPRPLGKQSVTIFFAIAVALLTVTALPFCWAPLRLTACAQPSVIDPHQFSSVQLC